MTAEPTKTNQKKKLAASIGVRGTFTKDGADVKEVLMQRKAALDGLLGAGVDTARVPITYIDPMFDPVLTLFPKENIRELNRRLRHYYNYHPIVRNVIDTHVEFSLYDFDIRCRDSKITKEYQEIKERLNLTELLIQAGRDYYLLGEGFLYGQWDNTEHCWSSFLQYPPENIEIYKTYVGDGVVYLLKPDDELKKMLTSSTAAAKAIAELIPQDFKEAVMAGNPYQLKNSNMIHLARKSAAYTPRGTPIVTSVLKYLLMEDKLMLLFMAFVDRNMFPIKLWKIGDAAQGLMPTKRQIEEFRALIVQAMNDPDFNIVTHPFVSASFETPVGKIENLLPHFEFLYKRILIGLFASDDFLKGSVSPYATAAVSAKLVMARYLAFRNRIETIIKRKIFLPIAIARKYFDENGDPIVPTLKWKAKDILNEQSEREMLMRLRDKGEIPFKVLADVFNLDVDWLKEMMNEEASTPFDPVYRDSIKEMAKDKKIIKEVVKGKKVTESVEKGITAEERITKPGRPDISDFEKKSPSPISPGTPSRVVPLEMGKETKPVGGEAPIKPLETPPA